jgi:hypothetical protein
MRAALFAIFLLASCSSNNSPDAGADLTVLDLAPLPCTATFTGAVTGTVGSCTAKATYDSSLDQTTIALGGAALTQPKPADATWGGLTIILTGMPTPGSFSASDVVQASTTVTANGGTNWMATKNPNDSFGTLTLTLAAVSEPMPLGGSLAAYQIDGTVIATMVTAVAGPSVKLSLSF